MNGKNYRSGESSTHPYHAVPAVVHARSCSSRIVEPWINAIASRNSMYFISSRHGVQRCYDGYEHTFYHKEAMVPSSAIYRQCVYKETLAQGYFVRQRLQPPRNPVFDTFINFSKSVRGTGSSYSVGSKTIIRRHCTPTGTTLPSLSTELEGFAQGFHKNIDMLFSIQI